MKSGNAVHYFFSALFSAIIKRRCGVCKKKGGKNSKKDLKKPKFGLY